MIIDKGCMCVDICSHCPLKRDSGCAISSSGLIGKDGTWKDCGLEEKLQRVGKILRRELTVQQIRSHLQSFMKETEEKGEYKK